MSPLAQAFYHTGCALRHVGKAALALCCSTHLLVAIYAVALTALLLLSTGCALIRGTHRAEVKANEILAGGNAEAPKDNGTPASVNSSGEETRLPIPQGSTITETTTEGTPAIPATVTTPAEPAKPAVVVREIRLSADTALVQKAQRVQTSTGTIDTAVALRKVEAAESRWLLWAAIGCGIGGLVVRSMVPAWPGLSNGLFAGAVCAFIAWKFSDLPAWFFIIPILIVAAKALGYKRAQWDANTNGIPDLLEKKTPPPP